MDNWGLCGPSNGSDLHPLTLLKGAHLFICLFVSLSLLVCGGHRFNGTYSHKKYTGKWTERSTVNVTQKYQINWMSRTPSSFW